MIIVREEVHGGVRASFEKSTGNVKRVRCPNHPSASCDTGIFNSIHVTPYSR
jgi:hypothetical protein